MYDDVIIQNNTDSYQTKGNRKNPASKNISKGNVCQEGEGQHVVKFGERLAEASRNQQCESNNTPAKQKNENEMNQEKEIHEEKVEKPAEAKGDDSKEEITTLDNEQKENTVKLEPLEINIRKVDLIEKNEFIEKSNAGDHQASELAGSQSIEPKGKKLSGEISKEQSAEQAKNNIELDIARNESEEISTVQKDEGKKLDQKTTTDKQALSGQAEEDTIDKNISGANNQNGIKSLQDPVITDDTNEERDGKEMQNSSGKVSAVDNGKAEVGKATEKNTDVTVGKTETDQILSTDRIPLKGDESPDKASSLKRNYSNQSDHEFQHVEGKRDDENMKLYGHEKVEQMEAALLNNGKEKEQLTSTLEAFNAKYIAHKKEDSTLELSDPLTNARHFGKVSQPGLFGKEISEPVKNFDKEIVDQIVKTVSLNLKDGRQEMTIRLKPEFLGRINLHISTEQHQVMVKVITEIPAVKEIIEQNIQQLRVEMGNHGLEIDKFDVFAEQGSNQKEQQFGKSSGSRQGEADSGADEENYLGLFEEMDQEYEYTIATGSINYFA